MAETTQFDWNDMILPFQLDNADVRGRIARLDGVLDKVLEQHDYPPVIEALVAETTLLTALIGQTIKLRWKLSIQIRGSNGINLVATDYYGPSGEGEPAKIRAYANFDAAKLDADQSGFSQLGTGYFSILIDQGSGTVPYQGIVPLVGSTLSNCAEIYFAQSEQLPTRFSMSFGESHEPGKPVSWRAGGIMLQHMPKASPFAKQDTDREDGMLEAKDLLDDSDSENWNRVNLLLDTVEEIELIGPRVEPMEVLYRLFHEEQPRVFDPQPAEFGCTCSAQKIKDSLSIYPPTEIATMVTEEGIVTADCQFCGRHYVFDPKELGSEASRDS